MWHITDQLIVPFSLLLIGSLYINATNEKVLQDFLNSAEWKMQMDNSFSEQNHIIIYPQHTISDNGTEGSPVIHRVLISAPKFDRNFSIDLFPNNDLFGIDFVILETFKNSSNLVFIDDKEKQCYFRGDKAALSLCNGITGIVHFNDKEYFIVRPLPKKEEDKVAPHLLIRKSIKELQHSLKNSDFSRSRVDNKNALQKRTKRESLPTGKPIFVETAVFVDKDLYEHMKINFQRSTEREIIRFVLAMINAVQLLYHDPSLGRPVNFVLKRLEILKEELVDLTRSPDIDIFLSNFCNWQKTKNPVSDNEPLHWDHALILTGLDLYVRGKHGKISSQVVGLAPVAGMCTTTSSCTVNEGRHFESVYVVAHEIGHNLGMRHDGPLAENDCDPSSYIMSPTLGSGKITWSACSKRYLEKFLESSQSRCLLDHSSSAGQLDHSAEGALPGERFDANKQCMLKYGQGSKHASEQLLFDVCRDLHCERERYTWTSHPALEGTKCGHNMWCKGGQCVSKDSTQSGYKSTSYKTSPRNEKLKSGWSNWRPFSECASGCLFGDEGKLEMGSTGIMVTDRVCNGARTIGTKGSCEGPEKKYESCNTLQCLNVPRLTIREFAEQICNRAKIVDKDLTGSGSQKLNSDADEACLVWCQTRNGGIKSRGWTFPDGTACRVHNKRIGDASYCIHGRCEPFTCNSYDESKYVLAQNLCATNREDNEVIWRKDFRRTGPIVNWKSVSRCYFSCMSSGAGIRLVVNKSNYGKSSIQLCEANQAGCVRVKSPFQHATIVCTKYKDKVRHLSGLGIQISPALEDPDRSCRVACQDELIAHRFYMVYGEEGWFPFGTDCSRGNNRRAYCISGKCLEFGADNTPTSESEIFLPLTARSKRSLIAQHPKIMSRLSQTELDEIIQELNRTLSGEKIIGSKFQSHGFNFNIDFTNPVHVNMQTHPEYLSFTYDHNQFDEEFWNYT